MRRRVGTSIGVLAILAAGCAAPNDSPAAHDDDDGEMEVPVLQIAAAGKVALGDVIATALAAHPGTALEAELEGEERDGKREIFYEVMIRGADGVLEVKLAADTGAILSAEREDDVEEAGEIEAVFAALSSPALTLIELTQRAESETGGRALAAEIELDDGKVVAEVKLLRDGALIEAELDVASGKVLEVEADDEDHDGHDDDDGDDDDHEDDDD